MYNPAKIEESVCRVVCFSVFRGLGKNVCLPAVFGKFSQAKSLQIRVPPATNLRRVLKKHTNNSRKRFGSSGWLANLFFAKMWWLTVPPPFFPPYMKRRNLFPNSKEKYVALTIRKKSMATKMCRRKCALYHIVESFLLADPKIFFRENQKKAR